MKNNKHTIPAFTIMEMTIAMLVAAIVIGITYTSYTIISKTYLGFKAKNENMAVVNRLDQLLKKDFEEADMVTASNTSVEMYNRNNVHVEYQFLKDWIIRKNMIVDTFKVNNDNYQVWFEKRLKNTENIDTENPENSRIDELEFNVSFQSELIPFHYRKVYSSADLFKRD